MNRGLINCVKNNNAYHVMTLILLILVMGQISCIDPYDYEPDYPDLADPPPPPELTQPMMNAIFDSDILPYPVDLEWQSVPGAEDYRLEVFSDSVFFETFGNIQSCSYNYSAPAYCKYYWRVSADSPAWKWYTDWSETRTFTVRRVTCIESVGIDKTND